ncbi:hypothetical protein DFP73DRAFT_561090 [Morchella snyderi]|nr:hypothetical protein DFP73DRAFT_561090 [Morchella snyderi]
MFSLFWVLALGVTSTLRVHHNLQKCIIPLAVAKTDPVIVLINLHQHNDNTSAIGNECQWNVLRYSYTACWWRYVCCLSLEFMVRSASTA